MSRTRYGWWAYVKDMIRRYPALSQEYADLHMQSITADYSGMPHGSGGETRTVENLAMRELPHNAQREYEAVRAAIARTKVLSNGTDRLKIIDLVFWRRSHTLEGAAASIPVSYRQAQRYHAEFILLVAQKFGFLD